MSTRGEIGVWFPEEKKLRVIYNHYDSYLKGVGKDLLEDYNSFELAKKVIDGDYNNEESEDEYNTEELWLYSLDGSDREYVYFFKDNKWYYTECYDNLIFDRNWKLLTEEIVNG